MARNPLSIGLGAAQLSPEAAKQECERFFNGDFDLPAPPDHGRLAPWQRVAYAEATLFTRIAGKSGNVVLPEGWSHFRPFGADTPTLENLLTIRESGMAFFPVCTESEAALYRMYIFADPDAARRDHRGLLCDSGMFDRNHAVFLTSDFSPSGSKLNGDSWQLAARLILNIPKQFRPALARVWLITGAVRNDEVKKVVIGAKKNLFARTGRKIMLPNENRGEFAALPDISSRSVCVNTIKQAIDVVSCRGFERSQIQLPENIVHLHVLVGESINPVGLAILLTEPSDVTLWCSSKTRQYAEIVKNAFDRLDAAPDIFIEEMDSGDLQNAYQTMSEYLTAQGAAPNNTVVSITGGNRLMGIATWQAAQSHNLAVVYRDRDGAPDVLTALKTTPSGRYESGDVRINRCRIKEQIAWHNLYGQKKSSSAAEFLELFFVAEAPNGGV